MPIPIDIPWCSQCLTCPFLSSLLGHPTWRPFVSAWSKGGACWIDWHQRCNIRATWDPKRRLFLQVGTEGMRCEDMLQSLSHELHGFALHMAHNVHLRTTLQCTNCSSNNWSSRSSARCLTSELGSFLTFTRSSLRFELPDLAACCLTSISLAAASTSTRRVAADCSRNNYLLRTLTRPHTWENISQNYSRLFKRQRHIEEHAWKQHIRCL